MPGGMLKGSIDITPTAGVIYQDHEGYGSPAKYVQRIKTLFQDSVYSFFLKILFKGRRVPCNI
jgi:hypothetical protein